MTAILGRARVYVVALVVWGVLLGVLSFDFAGEDTTIGGIPSCRPIGAITAYFVVVAILRTLWPMRVLRSNPFTFIGGGRTHQVHTFTGQTHSSSVSHESRTTGSGSVYSPMPGVVTGRMEINTVVTRLDRFSLTDGQGRQHTVEVKNAHVPVGDGQQLTAVWAIPQGRKTGTYMAFINHSTGTMTWFHLGLAKLAIGGRPGVAVLWALATGLLLGLGGYLVGVVAMFVCLFCLAFVSRIQARIFAGSTGMPLIRRLTGQS